MPSRHGDSCYPVIGETDANSGQLIDAIRQTFPLLPDHEVIDAIHKLRDANDLYGIALDDIDGAASSTGETGE